MEGGGFVKIVNTHSSLADNVVPVALSEAHADHLLRQMVHHPKPLVGLIGDACKIEWTNNPRGGYTAMDVNKPLTLSIRHEGKWRKLFVVDREDLMRIHSLRLDQLFQQSISPFGTSETALREWCEDAPKSEMTRMNQEWLDDNEREEWEQDRLVYTPTYFSYYPYSTIQHQYLDMPGRIYGPDWQDGVYSKSFLDLRDGKYGSGDALSMFGTLALSRTYSNEVDDDVEDED